MQFRLGFENLLQPFKIGTLELKHRIWMPTMAEQLTDSTGQVTQRMIDYYAERAKGGAAIMGLGAVVIDDIRGRTAYPQPSIDGFKFTAGHRDMTDRVHDYGGKMYLQMNFSGLFTIPEAMGGKPPFAPSEMDAPFIPGVKAKGLTIEEISSVQEKYVAAATFARHSGYDAVELQCSNGSNILQQFISSFTNKRTDEYGGDINGRVRIAVEIVEKIKTKLGNFPLIARINGEDHIEGGNTLEDQKVVAKKLEGAGVDALNITSGCPWTPEAYRYAMPPVGTPFGYNVPYSAAIKKIVNVPVIVCGRIKSPELAEKILAEGSADLVAMGRVHIADPEFSNKVKEGRLDEIRYCIGCFQECEADFGVRVKCSLNASVGKEREYALNASTKAETPKNVLIVGGGPAGMEAARVAALRGHEVTLYERNSELGGQMLLQSYVPFKAETIDGLNFFVNQMSKLGVKVELGKELNANLVDAINPDVVILATGVKAQIPSIPGTNKANVTTAWNVLQTKGKVIESSNTVIIVGGESVGAETAEFVSELGKKVILVDARPKIAIAADLAPSVRMLLMEKLEKKGVEILTGLNITEITDTGIIAADSAGKTQTINGDSVVISLRQSENTLKSQLDGKVKELYSIGDCLAPRRVLEAVHEASFISRQI